MELQPGAEGAGFGVILANRLDAPPTITHPPPQKKHERRCNRFKRRIWPHLVPAGSFVQRTWGRIWVDFTLCHQRLKNPTYQDPPVGVPCLEAFPAPLRFLHLSEAPPPSVPGGHRLQHHAGQHAAAEAGAHGRPAPHTALEKQGHAAIAWE